MTISLEKRVAKLEKLVAEQADTINDLREEKWAKDVIRNHNPNEESFPASVAEAIVKGVSPIKAFREYRGLSQAALATACDTSTQYVSQLETGHRKLGLKLAMRMAKALKVSFEDLV